MSKAVKKSELYQSLWDSCNQLRGSMDASQYKDYVLTLLFVKYVSDKATGNPYEEIQVPEGGSFEDMVALKNKTNIGEGMDKIVAKLAEANGLQGVITNAHFNDEAKLGKGKEMVDTLTGLIGIFQRPELDFSKNSANDDDIIGDAYEYLMRKFATESGKSKGQFYTPAEVARVLAKVIRVGECHNRNATVYDPACGSGSLLIRVLAEAPVELAGYGQEKDNTTAGLAKMNAVLHGKPTVDVYTGNTFSDPHNFETGGHDSLQRFDYVVANPPFSMKNWQNGLETCLDRFEGYGDTPPKKNGDYAWLMHILASLKSTGKAAVILPHGVLFRGNAEGTIREAVVKKGWVKGIIGLPANLFYGTGIPACILVLDKEHADARKDIFMIDASRGFVKDGNKNRLRECDVFRIVETFVNEIEDDPTYSRKVPLSEIEGENGYNLNLSRYLQSAIVEDIQDIDGHLNGGIPEVDLDALETYWEAFPALREKLFAKMRPGYFELAIERAKLRQEIAEHESCKAYRVEVEDAFATWMDDMRASLLAIDGATEVDKVLAELTDTFLDTFAPFALLDRYDVYQALLAYWIETMSDDVLLVARQGWSVAEQVDVTYKTSKKTINGEKVEVPTDVVKDFEGLVIPVKLIEQRYFAKESMACTLCATTQAKAEAELESLSEEAEEGSAIYDLVNDGGITDAGVKAQIAETLESADSELIRELVAFEKWFEESKPKKKAYVDYIKKHPACKTVLNDKGNATKTSMAQAIEDAKNAQGPDDEYAQDYEQLLLAQDLLNQISEAKAQYKALRSELDAMVREQYNKLSEDDIKDLLINKKWAQGVFDGVLTAYEQMLTSFIERVVELVNRYEQTLPSLQEEVKALETSVAKHLEEMGFSW